MKSQSKENSLSQLCIASIKTSFHDMPRYLCLLEPGLKVKGRLSKKISFGEEELLQWIPQQQMQKKKERVN